MEPKLSSEVMAGLKRVGNSTLVNDDVFLKLISCCESSITQPDLSSTDRNITASSSKADILKESHCALLSLVVEAARLDVPPEALHSFLETKVNWSSMRCSKLCGVYNEVLPKFQALLANVGFHPPHVVDVQWSLSHSVKSSSNEHVSSSVIAVQLETEGPTCNDNQRQVKFMCTVPEVQDLVSKLKEALRQMEHIAQVSHS